MQKSSRLWIESASNLIWKIRLPPNNKAPRLVNHQLPTLVSNRSRRANRTIPSAIATVKKGLPTKNEKAVNLPYRAKAGAEACDSLRLKNEAYDEPEMLPRECKKSGKIRVQCGNTLAKDAAAIGRDRGRPSSA